MWSSRVMSYVRRRFFPLASRSARIRRVLAATAVTGGGSLALGITPCDSHNAPPPRSAAATLSRTFVADAVEIASPSVVNIRCQVGNYFFGGEASGSGFIISKDGFVVTNAHVVEASAGGDVLVTLWDGSRHRGRVHSLDREMDVALVKIDKNEVQRYTRSGAAGDADGLPVAKLGKSSAVRPGELVVALGSPLLLSNSVTFGIISSTARLGSELGIHQNRVEYLQTDAAINVGNSGGPLVNLDGEVVGINTMKVQHSSGISFAIPVDTAMAVVAQLQAHGRAVRPYVGMRVANYTPPSGSGSGSGSDAEGFLGGGGDAGGRHKGRGKGKSYSSEASVVMVIEVEPGSPAAAAGLARGDVIVEAGGRAVTDVRHVLEAIGLDVGRSIHVKVRRRQDGGVFETTITPVVGSR